MCWRNSNRKHVYDFDEYKHIKLLKTEEKTKLPRDFPSQAVAAPYADTMFSQTTLNSSTLYCADN